MGLRDGLRCRAAYTLQKVELQPGWILRLISDHYQLASGFPLIYRLQENQERVISFKAKVIFALGERGLSPAAGQRQDRSATRAIALRMLGQTETLSGQFTSPRWKPTGSPLEIHWRIHHASSGGSSRTHWSLSTALWPWGVFARASWPDIEWCQGRGEPEASVQMLSSLNSYSLG